MRTITDTEEVSLEITGEDLLYEKWIPFERLSQKVAEKEKENGKAYKMLRNKLYNTVKGNKLNTTVFAGITCIDVSNPMKAPASLKINFIRK